jgi:thymidine phosphorylase
VPSIPLIVGSIISKKIAGGADAIVLDVKVGSGAFMKTEKEARALAAELTRVGHALGRDVVCFLSDMDQPLGMAVGNALEVREAIEVLDGGGPRDLRDVVLVLGARMLTLGQVAPDDQSATRMLENALDSGAALDRFAAWIEAQGGDPGVAHDVGLLPYAPCMKELLAEEEGFVSGFDAEGVGRAAMLLGAGRAAKDDVIDPAAGLVLDVRTADRISRGDRLATLFAAHEGLFDAAEERFRSALRLGDIPPEPRPLIREL